MFRRINSQKVALETPPPPLQPQACDPEGCGSGGGLAYRHPCLGGPDVSPSLAGLELIPALADDWVAWGTRHFPAFHHPQVSFVPPPKLR